MSNATRAVPASSAGTVAAYVQARQSYAGWLATQPSDAFAPATHVEVMALYDRNCKPRTDSDGRAPDGQDKLDLADMELRQWHWQLAQSVDGLKTLTARHTGSRPPQFIVEDYRDPTIEVRVLYQGYSLELAVTCYNKGICLADMPQPTRITLHHLIARSEAVPGRKAAMDRARIKRALTHLALDNIATMTPEQALTALCAEAQGQGQYDIITARAPGDAYAPLRVDNSISVEELVVGLFNTPEGRAEFETAGLELRQAMNLPGNDEDLLATIAKASLLLLQKARTVLADGLDASEQEADWSQQDRRLVTRIDDVLGNYLAKELLKAV